MSRKPKSVVLPPHVCMVLYPTPSTAAVRQALVDLAGQLPDGSGDGSLYFYYEEEKEARSLEKALSTAAKKGVRAMYYKRAHVRRA